MVCFLVLTHCVLRLVSSFSLLIGRFFLYNGYLFIWNGGSVDSIVFRYLLESFSVAFYQFLKVGKNWGIGGFYSVSLSRMSYDLGKVI